MADKILHLATRNEHKVLELQEMLQGRGWIVRSAADLGDEAVWVEDGTTFAVNALIKARALHRLTSGPVLADDSGLEVKWLDGAPGVRSARYAGRDGDDPANNALLRKNMAGAGPGDREARFVCCLAWIDDAGRESVYHGYCPGEILPGERGSGGFGYDPLFLVTQLNKSMAELSPEEKNAISHRRRAFDQWLQDISDKS